MHGHGQISAPSMPVRRQSGGATLRRAAAAAGLRHAAAAAMTLVLAAGLASPARAWHTIAEGEKGKLEVEGRLMFWGVSSGREVFGAAQDEEVRDFFVRRARLLIQGKPSDKLTVYFQLGQDNINQKIPTIAGSTRLPTEDTGFKFKDAYLNYKVREGFQVTAGMFKIPFLRSSLMSGFNQLLVDRALLPSLRPAREGSRDLGGMVWGNAGGFQYRTAIFDGSDQEDSNTGSSFRGSARVAYNWFTRETGPGYTGTSIGEKKILQIGAQVDAQNDRLDSRDDTTALAAKLRDYRSWAADVFYDQPIAGGHSAFTFEGAWLDRRDDYTDPTEPERRIDGFYAQAGFLLPGKVGSGRLQLAARWEELDSERGTVETETSRRTAGITWYGKGHDRKIQFDYTDRREEPVDLSDDEFRLSLLVAF